MTQEDFGLVLSALLEAREEVSEPVNVVGCDHILYGWLILGTRVWGYVSRTIYSDHARYHFKNMSWMFDKNGTMIGHAFVEVASSEVWTSELLAKVAEHYDLASSCGQGIENTAEMLEFLGVGTHPIPESDEDMLQQILEVREEE